MSYLLLDKGYSTSISPNIEESIDSIKNDSCDLLIINLTHNKNGELNICSHLNSHLKNSTTPTITLSHKANEGDIINLLLKGAHDHFTRPFCVGIFLAKVEALIKKTQASTNISGEEKYEIIKGPFQLSTKNYKVIIKNKEVALTLQEFKLLKNFIRHSSWVLTREQIIAAVHGHGYSASDRVIDVQISHLRKKISPYGKYIKTVRGVGYLFELDSPQREFDFTQ